MPNKTPEQKKKADPVKIEVVTAATAAPLKIKPSKARETGCTVRGCVCASPFQDARYGKGRRVFNCSKKQSTCTVCGRKQ